MKRRVFESEREAGMGSKPIATEVVAEAKRWLASTDCTDGHVMADYLAKAIIEAEQRALEPEREADALKGARVPRDNRQQLVTNWARRAFGEVEATNLPQRGIRLLEEAIEAYQACGGDAATAHKLVAYVFDRPPGEVGQELGGVAVCVLALAAAAGLSAEEEECREVARVLDKPVEEFTARNARKNAAGFRLVTVADEVLAELEKRPDAVAPVEISQKLLDQLMSDEEPLMISPSQTAVMNAAKRVREHWRAQDGINAALIDELCEVLDAYDDGKSATLAPTTSHEAAKGEGSKP